MYLLTIAMYNSFTSNVLEELVGLPLADMGGWIRPNSKYLFKGRGADAVVFRNQTKIWINSIFKSNYLYRYSL